MSIDRKLQQAASNTGVSLVGGEYIAVAGYSGAAFTLLDHTTPGSLALADTYNINDRTFHTRFSRDGKYILVGRDDAPNYVTILDHTTPGTVSLASTYTTDARVFGGDFSPDMNYLAVCYGGDSDVALLNFNEGSVSLATTYRGATFLGFGRDVRFSNDGDYIAFASTGSPYFVLMDHTTPGSLSIATTYTLAGTTQCYGVSWSPDDSYIACGASRVNSNHFTLLNHSSGSVSLATTYDIGSSALDVDFSPDGNYLAVGSATGVTLLSRSGGSLSLADTYASGQCYGLSFSPDGNYIAVGRTSAPYMILLNHSSGSLSFAASYNTAGLCYETSFNPAPPQ